MEIIQQVTSNALQRQTVVMSTGIAFTIEIYFRSMQQGWFINSLTYADFELNGMRIVNSPNMLNQWRNLLPFGLACFSTANREPSLIDDFSSGASVLYALTPAEVEEYTEFLRLG